MALPVMQYSKWGRCVAAYEHGQGQRNLGHILEQSASQNMGLFQASGGMRDRTLLGCQLQAKHVRQPGQASRRISTQAAFHIRLYISTCFWRWWEWEAVMGV